jgi:hypothetical protein
MTLRGADFFLVCYYTTMPELLIEQTRQFDENYFYSDYEQLPWRDQTLRHIGEHIAKAGLKLVEYNEGTRSADVVKEQVIPDLAIYRTQIVNLLQLNPADIDWEAQYDHGNNVLPSIMWAAGMIGRYIEPAEHLPSTRHETLTTDDLIDVPARLHFAALALAKVHNVDAVQAHLNRMAR